MKKILVIDDDSGIREGICQILETEGFMVESAPDGQSGLAKALSLQPDIILCDVVMPGMDGYAVISRLRENALTDTIPFVFLTGKSEPGDIRRGMNLGADDYLYKPFSADELLLAIQLRLKKNEALRQRSEMRMNALRDSIGFSMPHELNTPLAAILGFAETIQSDHELLSPEDVREMAGYIIDSAARLRETIKKFLMFTHLQILAENEEEKQRLRGRTCPISKSTIESMVKSCSKKYIREKDLSVEADSAEIALQYDYLLMMITELTDNAFKFSRPGQKVLITGRKDEDIYHLTIRDSGIGMSAEQIASVGAFVQFNRSRQEQQGSGLGLASVHLCADIFAAGISISPAEKQGLNVTLNLKISPPQEF
ncbi:MAG: response regulator [Ignavibacteriaceae bacterium]|nr:response regulator [Ignavibacteriaceae bacterium]